MKRVNNTIIGEKTNSNTFVRRESNDEFDFIGIAHGNAVNSAIAAKIAFKNLIELWNNSFRKLMRFLPEEFTQVTIYKMISAIKKYAELYNLPIESFSLSISAVLKKDDKAFFINVGDNEIFKIFEGNKEKLTNLKSFDLILTPKDILYNFAEGDMIIDADKIIISSGFAKGLLGNNLNCLNKKSNYKRLESLLIGMEGVIGILG